jgi:hypothetical protein
MVGRSIRHLKNLHYTFKCVGRPKSTLLDRSINSKALNPLHYFEDTSDLIEDLLHQDFGN